MQDINVCVSSQTWCGAVVGDEACHVYWFAVDGQVLYAAHKVPVSDGKIFREVWNTT